MRIFVDPGIYNLLNMGGVAMFRSLVERLRTFWPDATFQALTDDPEALARHVPNVAPVPHQNLNTLLSDRYLLGSLHERLPRPLSRGLIRSRHYVHRQRPEVIDMLTRLRLGLSNGNKVADYVAFLDALYYADFVAISGAGGLNDSFPGYVRQVLAIAETACKRRIPVVFFSQGIGPLQKTELVSRASKVLPCVGAIGVREGVQGPPLLRSLGVPNDRIIMTGDDAIEAAYAGRPDNLGSAIGINLRLAAYTGISEEIIAHIQTVVQQFARAHDAPLLPLPIALHQHSPDQEAIRQMLHGYDDTSSGGADLDTVDKVLAQAGRCRVAIAGAYHAAVFALSQGVPVICLGQSQLYKDKFRGLQDCFGDGCLLIDTEQPDLAVRLATTLEQVWEAAPRLRVSLLQATARQVEQSLAMYAHVYQLVEAARLSASTLKASRTTPSS
jgi:colanic acid/amylovoran biosynthesis protein